MMAGLGLLDSPEIREQPKKSAFGQKRQNVKRLPLKLLKPPPLQRSRSRSGSPAEEARSRSWKLPLLKAPAEEAVAAEAPAEEAPAEEAPAEDASAEEEKI